MAVGEEARQHELEGVPLADHRPLDLVEDARRSRPYLRQIHLEPLQGIHNATESLALDAGREPILR